MILPIIMSSFAANLIATTAMVLFMYLPILWNGRHFDELGALGSFFTKTLDNRARMLGGIIYYIGGFLWAILYGLLAYSLMVNLGDNLPQIIALSSPTEVNLVYLAFGAGLGLVHGLIAVFLLTPLISEHPLPEFKDRYTLVLSQFIIHVVYGALMLFFQHQFLQLLVQQPAS